MVVKKEYLLSTLWTQYDKVIGCGNNENLENGIEFNQYTPLDLSAEGTSRSYTGCAITAATQIIYYYLQNDAWDHTLSYDIKLDVLTENDAYVSFPNIPELTVYISAEGGGDAATLSFAEINDKLSVFVPAPTDPEAENYDSKSLAAADYIAALNFSVGVLHKAFYSDNFGTEAYFSADVFLRCGFKSAVYVDITEMKDAESSLWLTEDKKLTDEALEILIENLEQGKPISFGINGHAIVLDGYDSDSDMFHLNYGWGPDSEETKWYTREEFLGTECFGFVIDISPEYQETFTVTDSRVFGSGTLMRAVQQAATMQGDNTITFDAALAESDAVELGIELELKDNVTIDGFNMTLFGSDQKSEEGDVENQNADEGEKEEEESNLALFFGETGNRTTFSDFSGDLICSFQEKTKGAAIYFAEAAQLTLSTGNAIIYAGVSQFENADILEKIKSGSVEELLENSSKKIAIAGSDGDDRIDLADETLVIGDLELAEGHDTLTVTDNSTVYGNINVGSGDNTITLSGGASIYGNLLGEAKLNISLGSIFHITGDAGSTFENIVSLTVDASDAEENEYVIFNKGDINLLLEKLQIRGGGGIIAEPDGTIKWVAENGYTPEAGEEEQ
ncbi:MAG: C10 family peptidase, partial [Lentisphaeria bacterium]|nr:C10 family peptidase [Lentisphaeria bacterium]